MTVRRINTATRALLDRVINAEEVDRRRSQLRDPHVVELTDYVERVRVAHGDDATVPWFDPAGGGVHARVLLLMQDPSEVAAKGSGFISPDNNDQTARNTTIAVDAAELTSELRVHWNIYPWWVNHRGQDPTRPRESFAEAMHAAVPLIDELIIDLLVEIRVVVLFGNHAQAGWDRYVKDRRHSPIVEVLRCPHPSPLAWNKSAPDGRRNSDLIIETLRAARELAVR